MHSGVEFVKRAGINEVRIMMDGKLTSINLDGLGRKNAGELAQDLLAWRDKGYIGYPRIKRHAT